MSKVAVTGAAGMIGRHLVALLEFEKIDYLAITRSEWDFAEWKGFEYLDSLFQGVDVVFHFGAALPESGVDVGRRNTGAMFDANVRSCLNISEWSQIRNIPLVFLSGATVYQNPHGMRIHENDHKVVNGLGGFYGYTKLLAEQVIEHYTHQGLNAVILRPSSVYGYGLGNGKLIQNYLNLAASNKVISIEQPYNRINLIHAIDVAKAALQAYKKKSWGVYNIASKESSSILEIAEAAVKVCGGGIIDFDTQSNEGFVRFDLDCSKATHAFSFCPEIALRQGLQIMNLKQVLAD
jgi:UDP-glucose 4-epimerase